MIDHVINILKYKPLLDRNYVQLPKELDHPRIRKIGKDFSRKLDFKDIKFPVKIRDIHKVGRKNHITLVYLVMKIGKNIQYLYGKYF